MERRFSREEVSLLRESFQNLRDLGGDAAAAAFYERLFSIAPETRALFRTDLSEQGMRFMRTLGIILDHISDPARVAPYLRHLAEGHALYGVRPEHFAPMCEALIQTMREVLGDEFSEETAAAWRAAYDAFAAEMRLVLDRA